MKQVPTQSDVFYNYIQSTIKSVQKRKEGALTEIVSKDGIFARSLQIALKQAGLGQSELRTTLPESVRSLLIVDLDDFAPPLLRPCVTFSSDRSGGADFTRPFLLTDFIACCRERRLLTEPLPHLPAETVQALSPEALRTFPPEETTALHFTEKGVLLNGRLIPLSPKEETLLRLLSRHRGECVSKTEIDRLLGGKGNTTEVYIRYLRKKMDEPLGIRLIQTVRGKGYILCLPKTLP